MTTSPLTLDRTLRMLGTLWVGIMAGFFFAFSFVVMPGLDETEPLAAMASMQAINDAVSNAAFALGFFGAPVICLAIIATALVRRRGPALLGLVAAVIYLTGVFGVTVASNVPLNDELALLDATLPANAPAMVEYIRDWNSANHIRTLAGFTAFAMLAVSLLLELRREEPRGTTAK